MTSVSASFHERFAATYAISATITGNNKNNRSTKITRQKHIAEQPIG